jgi:hypothetical protein
MQTNEYFTTNLLNALLKTVIRRTEETYALSAIGAIFKTLEPRYDFLKYIKIEKDVIHDEFVSVSPKINNIEIKELARIIEVLFQIIYNDLGEKAGLFFIKEVQNNADYNVIQSLKSQGVDLELIEIQQQFLYRRMAKDTNKSSSEERVDNQSLLGYSLENVDHWEFDMSNKECLVYDSDNKVIDRIDINNIVQSYIVEHSEKKKEEDSESKLILNKTERNLLQILYSSDVDSSDVCAKLDISDDELNQIIQKLLKFEILHYISDNELILTDLGVNYLKKNN